MTTPALEKPSRGRGLRSCVVGADRAAARAAAKFTGASALLAALALAACAFVVLRLAETWHVTPHAASHHISILGHRVTYPTANAAAVVVLALAAAGLIVAARALSSATRELTASRRFTRGLAARHPGRLKGALLLDDEHPLAFCAGLFRPQVYITKGAVAILDEQALEAVLMHERHHARRRDPLRLAASRVLGHAIFFLPGLRTLSDTHETLAELSADETAIGAAEDNRAALARAMLRFVDEPVPGGATGIDPARVDQLLGEAPSWRFPALLFLAASGMLALMVAIGLLVGKVADGSATLAPPFLSAQPCVVVLALIPVALGFASARFVTAWRPASVAVASKPG